MSLTLTLYNVTDNPKKVNKTLGDPVYTFNDNVKPTDPCDLLNPSFIIDYDVGPISANYCIVGTPFNRNYFITDVEMLTGGRKKLICSVDALTTYAAGITAANATVIRSSKIGHPTLVADSKLPVWTNERTTFIDNFPDTPFGTTITNPYILTTIGGTNT